MAENDMSGCRVFIGRLSPHARERDVEKFFKGYGRIREINLKNGFGFVEFDDHRDADDAVYELNGKELCSEGSLSSMLAPDEEEVAALEWDVSVAAVGVVVVEEVVVVAATAAMVAAIAHLAAVDPGTALQCGRTTGSLWRTSLHGSAGSCRRSKVLAGPLGG
ncbi:unnamed protein product [Pleuronectes platessa]|uniref:RRM domain-containing protein n=1 Tax=Pleuronectes platessa TaxID=8262 RepID=A0A9N7TSW0_PLEPL|nr:unnamed protein product [Pleuronectes platessa]